jgi:hypothetical protein
MGLNISFTQTMKKVTRLVNAKIFLILMILFNSCNIKQSKLIRKEFVCFSNESHECGNIFNSIKFMDIKEVYNSKYPEFNNDYFKNIKVKFYPRYDTCNFAIEFLFPDTTISVIDTLSNRFTDIVYNQIKFRKNNNLIVRKTIQFSNEIVKLIGPNQYSEFIRNCDVPLKNEMNLSEFNMLIIQRDKIIKSHPVETLVSEFNGNILVSLIISRENRICEQFIVNYNDSSSLKLVGYNIQY